MLTVGRGGGGARDASSGATSRRGRGEKLCSRMRGPKARGGARATTASFFRNETTLANCKQSEHSDFEMHA